MNRLQKKCIIGTVGIHLLLLVILIVGPAFYNQQPKTDDTTVLDMIPANLVDAAVNSGVQGAQPPKPVVTPQPPPPQQLFAPPKNVQPPTPAPAPEPVRTPSPSLLKEFEKYFESKPKPTVKPDLTQTERQPTTQTHTDNIKIDLHKVKRTDVKNTSQPDNSKAIKNALTSLSHSLSSATTVDMPGNSSASSASYKDALATIYYNAWTTPENASSDAAITKAHITVARDGTVLNAEIITSSGDAAVDNSVRQALDRVSSVPPLSDQSKDQQEFIISFDLKTKRMLE